MPDFIHSKQRLKYPAWRAPGSDRWQRISREEAFDRIARLMKADCDAHFQEKNAAGVTVNRWLTTGMLCSSAASNETGLMHILGTPQLARLLHPFVGTAMFFAFLLMFFRYWRHNLPEREDLVWAKNIYKIALNEEVGDTGRYNFGQKCVFWAAIASLLLLFVSGIVIWRPWFADAFTLPLIRVALLVHSVSATLLIVVILVHVYAALWVKGTLTAMVEGWVSDRWAQKHHPRWYRTLRQRRHRLK